MGVRVGVDARGDRHPPAEVAGEVLRHAHAEDALAVGPHQLSEPLGAFLLLAAFVALALALKRRQRRWYVAAGALFGLAILTRTDLLPVPFLIAGVGGLIALIRTRELRSLIPPALLLGTAVVVLAPWTIYASSEEGRFIPVTKGSAAALFVGTYLPGGGTTGAAA